MFTMHSKSLIFIVLEKAKAKMKIFSPEILAFTGIMAWSSVDCRECSRIVYCFLSEIRTLWYNKSIHSYIYIFSYNRIYIVSNTACIWNLTKQLSLFRPSYFSFSKSEITHRTLSRLYVSQSWVSSALLRDKLL